MATVSNIPALEGKVYFGSAERFWWAVTMETTLTMTLEDNLSSDKAAKLASHIYQYYGNVT